MSNDAEIIRGGHAGEVLDSVVFKEAKARVRDGILAQMARVPMGEEKMHTRLIITLQLWNALEDYLTQIQQTGKIAAFQVKQEEERKKLFKVFG